MLFISDIFSQFAGEKKSALLPGKEKKRPAAVIDAATIKFYEPYFRVDEDSDQFIL